MNIQETVFDGAKFRFAYDVDKNLGGDDWNRIVRWCIANVEKNNATYIEVGCQIGYMATLTLLLADPKFSILIEPDPETVKLLRWNLTNNCPQKVEGKDYVIVEKLILDKEGSFTFYKNLDNPAQNSIYERSEYRMEKIESPATTIDQLAEQYQIKRDIVMKIDAEFAEPLIWKGMQKTLPLIKAICMEYQPEGLKKYTGENPNDFLSEIEKYFNIDVYDSSNICLYKRT